MLLRSDEWWLTLCNRIYLWSGIATLLAGVVTIAATKGIQIYSSRVDTTNKQRIAELELTTARITKRRKLSNKQKQVLAEVGHRFPGESIFVFWQSGDTEVEEFANSIADSLKSGGLNVSPITGSIFGHIEPRISLSSGRKRKLLANAIADAVVGSGIEDRPIVLADWVVPDQLRIIIGPKE